MGLPFIPSSTELRPVLPEIVLIITIIATLIAPFFPRRGNIISAFIALAGLLASLVVLLSTQHPALSTPFLRGMLLVDPLALLWKATLFLFVIGIIIMWIATASHSMHEGDGPEFFTLLVGATLGMSLMACTSNLLMLLIAVELASFPSYVLAGFRKTHRVGAEAALKYVLFGAASTSVMVYGLSLLYGMYGTLQIEQLAAPLSAHPSALAAVAIFTIIVGLGFKISAVPFHFWCPDVFEGASIDVSAFLSVASKGAGLVMLLRVVMLIASSAMFSGSVATGIAIAIGVIGAITATAGNAGALAQNNIKRLLAYSSIAHAGYMLCALSLLLKVDGDPATEAAQALTVYLLVYMLMNLGAFTVAAAIGRATGSEQLDAFANLKSRQPLLAACMTVFMISLVGLPPVAGFFVKLNLMITLGSFGGAWWILVAVIGVNTILSCYYYFRVIKMMYFTGGKADKIPGNPLAASLATTCAVLLVVLFFAWNPLAEFTHAWSVLSLPHNTVTSAR